MLSIAKSGIYYQNILLNEGWKSLRRMEYIYSSHSIQC